MLAERRSISCRRRTKSGVLDGKTITGYAARYNITQLPTSRGKDWRHVQGKDRPWRLPRRG